MKKNKYYYQNVKNIIIDIDLNKKVHSIIEKDEIPVNIMINDDNKLNINSSSKAGVCHTIKCFINSFPNIVEKEIHNGIDIIKLIEEMNIPNELEGYFNLIKEHIKKNYKENENNFDNINNKIYDFVMEKLEDKLFPNDIDTTNIKIMQNCFINIWIEPYNLINTNKNYVFESCLPDAIYYFKKLEEEASPRKKFLYLNEIYNCIYNLGKFNEEKIDCTDKIIPLLNYVLIKAKPVNIYNNCRYMKLFLGDKKFQIEGNQLTKLMLLCKKMENFSYKDLFNITETDYEENYKLVTKGILY